MNDCAMVFEGVGRRYRGFQLGPIDLAVPKGKIIALIGPNGSGKTTLINAAMNFDPRAAGRVTILGRDSRKEEVEIRRRLGYVGERPILLGFAKLPWLVNYVRGFYPTWDDDYCVELARKFRLPADRRISKFSKGMQVRTALLLALSHRPELLILDEPTSGLDAEVRREVFDQMLEVIEDEGRSVFLSGHNLLDIERIADRIVMISEGRILLEGDKSELLASHRRISFRAEFLPQLPEGMLLSRRTDPPRHILETTDPARCLSLLSESGAEEIEESPMTLEDIFIAHVRRERGDEG